MQVVGDWRYLLVVAVGILSMLSMLDDAVVASMTVVSQSALLTLPAHASSAFSHLVGFWCCLMSLLVLVVLIFY